MAANHPAIWLSRLVFDAPLSTMQMTVQDVALAHSYWKLFTIMGGVSIMRTAIDCLAGYTIVQVLINEDNPSALVPAKMFCTQFTFWSKYDYTLKQVLWDKLKCGKRCSRYSLEETSGFIHQDTTSVRTTTYWKRLKWWKLLTVSI